MEMLAYSGLLSPIFFYLTIPNVVQHFHSLGSGIYRIQRYVLHTCKEDDLKQNCIEAGYRSHLTLNIGLFTRFIAWWFYSMMLLRYLNWCTKIGILRLALSASMAAVLAPLLSIETLSGYH